MCQFSLSEASIQPRTNRRKFRNWDLLRKSYNSNSKILKFEMQAQFAADLAQTQGIQCLSGEFNVVNNQFPSAEISFGEVLCLS